MAVHFIDKEKIIINDNSYIYEFTTIITAGINTCEMLFIIILFSRQFIRYTSLQFKLWYSFKEKFISNGNHNVVH